MAEKSAKVAIVDYGMGNLFSVKHACEYVGMEANITSLPQEIKSADAVILPGVGAFGNAMKALRNLDLVGVLQDVVASDTPLMGICLGMQLLMTESYEFGWHKGLEIIQGQVIRFDNPKDGLRKLKVPQVGWNRIHRFNRDQDSQNDPWADTPLEGLTDGEFMYFVHSFVAQPEDPSLTLSTSRYGHIEFCSSLRYKNIFACQFHPERSSYQGLKVYSNFALLVNKQVQIEEVEDV